jgi:hypothetical protein
MGPREMSVQAAHVKMCQFFGHALISHLKGEFFTPRRKFKINLCPMKKAEKLSELDRAFFVDATMTIGFLIQMQNLYSSCS